MKAEREGIISHLANIIYRVTVQRSSPISNDLSTCFVLHNNAGSKIVSHITQNPPGDLQFILPSTHKDVIDCNVNSNVKRQPFHIHRRTSHFIHQRSDRPRSQFPILILEARRDFESAGDETGSVTVDPDSSEGKVAVETGNVDAEAVRSEAQR
nr:hypothetical protein Iba_chr12fCG17250 [Ipomoea batatas]